MFCIFWYTLVYYGILWFSQNRPNTLYQLAQGFCAVQRSFTAAVGKLRNLLKQDSLPAKVKRLGLQEADHSSLYLKKKILWSHSSNVGVRGSDCLIFRAV